MKKNSIHILALSFIFSVSSTHTLEEVFVEEAKIEKKDIAVESNEADTESDMLDAESDVAESDGQEQTVRKRESKREAPKKRITREPYKFEKISSALEILSSSVGTKFIDLQAVLLSLINSNQESLDSKLDALESGQDQQLTSMNNGFECIENKQKKLSLKLKALCAKLEEIENAQSQQSALIESNFESITDSLESIESVQSQQSTLMTNNFESIANNFETVKSDQEELAVKLDALIIVVSTLVELLGPSSTYIDSFIN